MKRAATFVHRWRLVIWRDLRRMTEIEWAAVGLTLASISYFLAHSGYSWKSVALMIGMLALGLMAGGIVHDLWFGRR